MSPASDPSTRGRFDPFQSAPGWHRLSPHDPPPRTGADNNAYEYRVIDAASSLGRTHRP
jgi:hypothetical protein